jgi:hypothetical protein
MRACSRVFKRAAAAAAKKKRGNLEVTYEVYKYTETDDTRARVYRDSMPRKIWIASDFLIALVPNSTLQALEDYLIRQLTR